ncbi:hypothetical protein [Mycobacterium sp.]|uniref:hypothetical protein n=1 Tax=Mycobacterium sp. TaxID=1785 RepID=UPI002C85F9D4|nr:hypothetical protein [Mycobacterium sp.]HME49700.1 hypothetical protein [Mycobacterium sp.]
MKRFTIGAAIAGMLAAGSLALACTADATAISGSSASDAISQLRAQGYNVQLNTNGTVDVPLSECTVSGIHGLPQTSPVGQPAHTTQLTTVYVDVDCPPDN